MTVSYQVSGCQDLNHISVCSQRDALPTALHPDDLIWRIYSRYPFRRYPSMCLFLLIPKSLSHSWTSIMRRIIPP